MPPSSPPILVVGAGPVGLTAAAALRHYGIPCRLIDKVAAPSDKSKALVVWCRSLELLADLGLAETFVRTGLKLTGGSIYADGERVVHLALTSDESRYGFPLMIPQNETERLLIEHLSRVGVTVERQVELVTFVEANDQVNCTLRHSDGREESMETPFLVGCDGAHSTVRHTLGMEFAGQAEPNDWMLADVHIEGPIATNEVTIHWAQNGVLAFFPIGHGRFRIIADSGAATGPNRPADPTLPEVQAKVDERGPDGLTLSAPIWLTYFRINERKVVDYRKGHVLLAGDAAHVHSPAGGQGMNTGMQDAFNLAWKLAMIHNGQGKAEPLLNSYSVERSAVGDQVLRNAERFTTLATLRSPALRWLRNHIAPILAAFPPVTDKIRDNWFELSINYRHSPLSAEQWPMLVGGLPAGDRLCDAPVVSAGGERATLFEAIQGNRHALLLLPESHDPAVVSELVRIADDVAKAFPQVFDMHLILKSDFAGTAPTHANVFVWTDAEGRVYERLHATHSTLVLVRPDGYIGYRCQPADGKGLAEYLERYAQGSGIFFG